MSTSVTVRVADTNNNVDTESRHDMRSVVGVQFINESSFWEQWCEFMEVNLHSLVNNDYTVDRLYWSFGPGDYDQCNSLIRELYKRVGEKFSCVFTLKIMDHKQSVAGTICDMDVHVDRERGAHMIRVMADLAEAVTGQHAAGRLAGVPVARPLAELLADAQQLND